MIDRGLVNFLRSMGIILVIFFHILYAVIQVLHKKYNPPETYSHIDKLISDFPNAFSLAFQALGSEIIFIFSGFLISYYLLRDVKEKGKIDIYHYTVKRISRIVPLYFIAVFLYGMGGDWDIYQLFLNLAFISKIFNEKTIVPVGWSMEVTMQMYVVLPLLVILISRLKKEVGFFILCMIILVSLIPIFTNISRITTYFYNVIYFPESINLAEKSIYYLALYRSTPFLLGFLLSYILIHYQELVMKTFSGKKNKVLFLFIGIFLTIFAGNLPIQDRNSFIYNDIVPSDFWLYYSCIKRFTFSIGIIFVFLTFITSLKNKSSNLLIGIFQWEIWENISRSIFPIYLFHFIFIAISAVVVLGLQDFHIFYILFIDYDKKALYDLISISTLDVFTIFILSTSLSLIASNYIFLPIEDRCISAITHVLIKNKKV